MPNNSRIYNSESRPTPPFWSTEVVSRGLGALLFRESRELLLREDCFLVMMDSRNRYGVKVESEKTNNELRLSISIDEESGIPIWLQLRNRLIYLIVSGAIAPNEKLPTVREMAVELGINYNTVSKVYQDIERDGYIVSKRGKGTFASDVPAQEGEALKGGIEYLVDDFIRQCREFGVPRQEIVGLVERRLGESGLFDR